MPARTGAPAGVAADSDLRRNPTLDRAMLGVDVRDVVVVCDRELITDLAKQLDRLTERLDAMTTTERESLTVAEFAKITGWTPAIVREWLREGRIEGAYDEKRRERWAIDPEELKRVPRKKRSDGR
jgi:hypothetical protein